MKIYILCDMEGISGVRRMEMVQSDKPSYAEGCRLMMGDANAAIDGCFLGGATEVVVADTHGGGGQFQLAEMDPRAVYDQPHGGGNLMPALDDTFAGVILLGHHGMAGTPTSFLDHTMNSGAWFEYRINDVEVGEIGIEAAYAGHYGVPVIMTSGDNTVEAETKALLGEVEVAVVKQAISRNRARCLGIPVAQELIRETARRAVERAANGAFKPYQPSLPATIQLTLYRTDTTEDFAAHPTVERIGGRTVRRRIETLKEVCRW